MYNIIKTTVTISIIQKIQFTMLFVHNKLKKKKEKQKKEEEIMQARPHLSNSYSVN